MKKIFMKSNQNRRCDKNLLFTRKNIGINGEIEYDGEGIHAYIEVWFNPEKKFGIKLRGDDYINVYAYMAAYKDDVDVRYIIHRCDGRVEDEQIYNGLTQDEKALIRDMVNEVSMKKTGKNVDSNWLKWVKNLNGVVQSVAKLGQNLRNIGKKISVTQQFRILKS